MVRLLKPATFLLSLLPLVWICYQIWLLQSGSGHDLGADPGKAIVLFFGEWAISFLVLTLALTPLRTLLQETWPVRVRRMLGLFMFFYASLHLASYAVFLLELDVGNIARDLAKRPYISVGFAGWLLLLPLALTSTNAMVRRLGRRWRSLHRLVYVVAVLAVLHVFWLAKSSYFDAFLYGLLLLFLLSSRVFSSAAGLLLKLSKAHF